MSTQQPDAREFTMSQYASKDCMIGAMRERIAELESQLESSGFTAADMATAEARGFRDGVASVAASAGEPVAWLDPWTGAKATTDYDAYGKHGIPLYTVPQLAPAPSAAADLIAALASAPKPSSTPQADSQPALPEITAEDRSFLHYNPNTDDVVDWVHHYASAAIASDRAARAPADSVLEDAARYRWIAAHCRSTSEHWGGRWSIIIDGPAPKSHDGEDDFDEAVDAARAAKEGAKHGAE